MVNSELREKIIISVFTIIILFPVVFQPGEQPGRENKKREDWVRGRGVGSRAFHVCISLYIASCLCLVLTSDSLFALREK